MTGHVTLVAPSLPVLTKPAVPPLDALVAASGPVFMALFRGGRDMATLQSAIAGAEQVLASADAIGGQLREAVEPESVEEIKRQLGAFGFAWPNASRADLAGYGGQLLLDVAEREPCRYALRSALRHLRQTSRFLPAISEVLEALDAAQARARDTTFHLDRLPMLLEHARADLVAAQARERHASPEGSS